MPNRRRQSRVAERIKQEASNIILQELQDPRMGFVTVTDARISADLQYAQIYISVLGAESEERKTMQALEHAKGYIQRAIAQRIGLRRAPIISLHVDESAKKRAQMLRLIKQIKEEKGEEEEKPEEQDAPAPGDPPREES